MNLSFYLESAGVLQLALALAHFWFPRRFDWKGDLAKMSLLNRQIFIVHCLFIVLVLLLFGGLSLFGSHLLLQSNPLARVVLAALLIFWSVRLWVQWFVYDHGLCVGRRFETMSHFGFTALWTYFVLVYACALHRQLT